MDTAVRKAYITAGAAAVKAADAADAVNVAEMAVSAARITLKAARELATETAAHAVVAIETAEDTVLNFN